MPLKLDRVIWERLDLELRMVRREVVAKLAEMPVVDQRSLRFSWYAEYLREVDRTLGLARGQKIPLARRLVEKLPVKQVYSDAVHESAGGLHVAAPRMPVKAIEWLEQNGLVHLEGLQSQLRTRLLSEVQAGMMRGEGTRAIAKRLGDVRIGRGAGRAPSRLGRGVFESVQIRARLIAQDQLARAHLAGRALVYEEEEVEAVQIIGKETACPVCAPWIGQVVTLEYARANYPRHPRCMCDWVAAIRKGLELVKGASEKLETRMTNDETGAG